MQFVRSGKQLLDEVDKVHWRFQILHKVHNTKPNNAFILQQGKFDAIKEKDALCSPVHNLNRKEDGETGKKLISSFKVINDFFMSNVYLS